MQTAVHFGAGNIGRGFLGQLYCESGYKTVFVDVRDEIVSQLQKRNGYPLRLVADEAEHTLQIKNVTALHGVSDRSEVAKSIANARIVSTAVGANVLPNVAPSLAEGITQRFAAHPGGPPLDVIVCENMIEAGAHLRGLVREKLPSASRKLVEERVGFVDASIGRMVPVMTAEQHAENPLLVCVEPYCELPVDAAGFKGPIPDIRHMTPHDNFRAYVERKLFVHNAGHAVTAYLGYLRHHEYIRDAVADPLIRAEADAAMNETCTALARKHGLDIEALHAHWLDLVERFGNRALGDQVTRVAKDPVRKLGPNDRLIGAARLCVDQGIEPFHVAFAAAAAIRYDHGEDPTAGELQELLQDQGLPGVLARVCRIPDDSSIASLIREGIERLCREGWTR